MRINGVAIENYRSFGGVRQTIESASELNVIVGKNNVGKSNVLRTLVYLLPQFSSHSAPMKVKQWDDDLDKSRFSDAPAKIGLFVPASDLVAYYSKSHHDVAINPHLSNLIAAIQKLGLTGIWAYKRYSEGRWTDQADENALEICRKAFSRIEAVALDWTGAANSGDGHNGNLANSQRILQQFNPFQSVHSTMLIPANRSTKFQVTPGSGVQDNIIYVDGIADFGGAGLVQKLGKLQLPAFAERGQAKKFREFNEFVRSVIGNESALLQVPQSNQEINLEINGELLPLASYGSGIEQIVIVAAAATAVKGYTICLEEPETNLHPAYQVKLLEYLRDKTENQYFVTTHSHSVIDIDRTSVFSVALGERGSVINRLLERNDRYEVVFDLGYRPSDLAQCNCVIWVEGPSDRIYLKAALEAADVRLSEGTDYSILFYGGRLLKHLTADDRRIDEFIVLTHINRRSAIVIDSDKSNSKSELNSTKLRVIQEFNDRKLFVWVTQGREIENYVEPTALQLSIEAIWPDRVVKKSGRFTDLSKAIVSKSRQAGFDKVRLAHEVVRQKNLAKYRFDWSDKIEALLDFVHSSN